MFFDCKNCNNKIILTEDIVNLEGKLIKCNICKEEFIHHTKTYFLESRLAELDQELKNKDSLINETNIKYNEKIHLLEKELINKKKELDKQKILEEKVFNFESRMTETERLNAHQADLETQIFKLEKEVKKTSTEILAKNESIEKKATYLEMKADTINKEHIKKNKKAVNDSQNDVLNFKSYEKKESKDKITGKTNFFWNRQKDK